MSILAKGSYSVILRLEIARKIRLFEIVSKINV